MKINDIKFTPKSNAFAEVYGKATGVPFIGELVAAAAGNGGEPTPTSDYIVLAPPTIIDEWYDTNPKLECSGGSCGVNMLFLSDLQRTTVRGACTVGDRTDTTTPMAINQISDTGTEYDGMYSLDFVFAFDNLTAGNHNFSVVITADGETFNISGSFTVPEEQFQLTINVIKEDEYTCTIDVTSNMPAPVENASIYIFDDTALAGCIGDYTTAFEGHFVPSLEDPTVWISDDYSYDFSGLGDGCGFTYVAQADWIEGSVYVEYTEQTYEHAISGTWTYEDQTI